VAKLAWFEAAMGLVNSAGHILFAYFSPTIWALVYGGLLGPAVNMIVSHFLLSDVKPRFHISREYSQEILHFGKWIFISSIVYFLSTNFDRLYFAKVLPVEVVGVYGIARSISELVALLVTRLGSNVLFPFIASHANTPRAELRAQLISLRGKYLLLMAVGVSIFAATADLAIRIFYDQRYQAAGWILPVLIIGSWFSILANVNEATLMGLGKPVYSAASNGLKFAFLLIGLPLSANAYGLIGGVMVVALADLGRYAPMLVGQRRERFSFGLQDLLLTGVVFAVFGLLEWLRWAAGLATSFDTLPI
jgi:O-antigen/teichoic acid export membrane protein